MTIDERCDICGGPIYAVGSFKPDCFAEDCPRGRALYLVELWTPGELDQGPAPVVTPPARYWTRQAIQMVAVALATALSAALAALGFALPPRVMLVLGGVAFGVAIGSGVWVMAGELVDYYRGERP